MVKKLAIRSLRRGIGSMDYIDTLLIMEDHLDEDDQDAERLGEFGESSHDNPFNSGTDLLRVRALLNHRTQIQHQNPHLSLCQIGALVANADQCHNRSKINVASKRNA